MNNILNAIFTPSAMALLLIAIVVGNILYRNINKNR